MIQISDARLERMDSEIFRHELMGQLATDWIAYQIRVLRTERKWTQAELGFRCEKPQSTIGRLENPSYGRWNIGTLLELAKAFDVALEVKFVDWPTFTRQYANLSSDAMRVPGWSVDQFRVTSATSAPTNNVVHLIQNFKPTLDMQKSLAHSTSSNSYKRAS